MFFINPAVMALPNNRINPRSEGGQAMCALVSGTDSNSSTDDSADQGSVGELRDVGAATVLSDDSADQDRLGELRDVGASRTGRQRPGAHRANTLPGNAWADAMRAASTAKHGPPGGDLPRRSSLHGGETRAELQSLRDATLLRVAQSRSLALLLSDFGQTDFGVPVHNRAIPPRPDARRAAKLADEAAAFGLAVPPPPPAELSVSLLSLLMVLFGCCCQAPVEVLATADRGCGDLISLSELAFGLLASAPGAISEGALFGRPDGRGGTRRRKLPLRAHAILALLTIISTKLFNLALSSPLPAVVASSLKNGSLVANVVVGAACLGKRYSARQLAAVALVTLGLLCTARGGGGDAAGASDAETAEVLLGVVCICGALLARAATGAVQEAAFRRYGMARAAEVLFFRNALGLPLLLLRCDGLSLHLERWRGDAVEGLGLPRVWLLLLANLVFDYASKIVMTRLIAQAGALHATLALTVQKFSAFALAALILEPQLRLSPRLWIGAAAVLAGTVAYTKAPPAAEATHGGRAATKKRA